MARTSVMYESDRTCIYKKGDGVNLEVYKKGDGVNLEELLFNETRDYLVKYHGGEVVCMYRELLILI